MQYTRNEADFQRGTFRVRGDTHRHLPGRARRAGGARRAVRRRGRIAPVVRPADRAACVRRSALHGLSVGHYVTPRDTVLARDRDHQGGTARAARFLPQARTVSWRRSGWSSARASTWRCCRNWASRKGIENYSRHLSGAKPGEPPPTLVDYLPPDALMFLDESHVLIGQLSGMYNGDRARKTTLVEYGFRLPSALDNRPLKFEEFERKMRQVMFVSATPARVTRRTTRRQGGRSRWCGRPAWSDPIVDGAPGHDPGRRPAVRDQRSACRPASACWSPR